MHINNEIEREYVISTIDDWVDPLSSKLIEYINEFCRKKDISSDCRKQALAIVRYIRINSINVWGKNPKSVSAAILYRSSCDCNEGLSQPFIAELMGVSVQTLKKMVGEFRRLL